MANLLSAHTDLGGYPEQLGGLSSRRQELAVLRDTLATSRVLTLTGQNDLRQDWLASRAARRLRRTFADGARTVRFADGGDASLLPHVMATAVGVRDDTRRPMLDVLAKHLQNAEMLLVLRNCEVALTPCALLVTVLLHEAPGVRILATSHEPLGVPGERVLVIGGAPRSAHSQRSSANASV